jgi:hypothetical protein
MGADSGLGQEKLGKSGQKQVRAALEARRNEDYRAWRI